jgi:hypothetical protein
VINGDRAWRKPPLPVRSAQGDGRVIDVGDFERSLARQAHNARQQMTFYTLGWLVQALPSFPLELSYAGEYETEGRLADIIVAQGPDEFRLALLLDQKTHLPLALAFSFVEARRETVLVEAASVSRKFMQDTYLRARQERQARARQPERIEVQWRFSDHRPVEGLLLPHRITTAFNGELSEELVITELALNRPINAKKFEGQPKEKY